MRRWLSAIIALVFCSLIVSGVEAQDFANATPSQNQADYAVEWMELLYARVEGERRNVPQAARIYGYAGVTLYESVRGGFADRPSLVGRLNDMPELPAAAAPYDWITVMNGAMTTIIPELMAPPRNFGRADSMTGFNTAESNATRRAVSALSQSQLRQRTQSIEDDTILASFAYGRALGEAILAWAATDGFADTREMTAAYQPPVGDDLWVSTTQGQRAMEPYWGTLRPFVLADASDCAVPLDVPFDSDLDSTFHQQAMEVRDMQSHLTDDQREVARFWDERIGESGTASGHWLYVENLFVDYYDLTLEQAAEMYALVGVAMADAFISAWKLKYEANLPRPETYINTYVDPTWEPVRQAPPFPAYPSGHAVLGASVSEVMTALFGPVAYTDRYGVQYGMQARHYTSFEAAAYENAISRLYAGVHFRVDMENGMRQGRCIGETVVERLMHNE